MLNQIFEIIIQKNGEQLKRVKAKYIVVGSLFLAILGIYTSRLGVPILPDFLMTTAVPVLLLYPVCRKFRSKIQEGFVPLLLTYVIFDMFKQVLMGIALYY